MSKKNPTITVYPVSWNGKTGQQLKCQAVAELNGVRIFSDPKSDMDEAVISLMEECKAFLDLVLAVGAYAASRPGIENISRKSKAAMKLLQQLSSDVTLNLDFTARKK